MRWLKRHALGFIAIACLALLGWQFSGEPTKPGSGYSVGVNAHGAFATPPHDPEVVEPAELHWHERDAVEAALAHLASVRLDAQPFVRYVFVRFPDESPAVSFLANAVLSRLAIPLRATEWHGGRLCVIDFAIYYKDAKERDAALKLWDELAADPHFRFPNLDGKFEPLPDTGRQAVLIDILRAKAPIVDHRYLLARALATLNIGLGRGLYYDLRGVPNDEQDLLKQIRADLDAINELRTAMYRSGVTGRTRRVIVRPTLNSLLRGQGLVWITQDPSIDQAAAANNAVKNLDDGFVFAATELIATLPNGFHLWSLYDAAGKRQDVAPDRVVADRRVPDPHPTLLQPGISCIRCHDRGLKDMRNDVLDELATRLTIVAEQTAKNTDQQLAALQRLAERYTWRPELQVNNLAIANYEGACRAGTGLGAKAVHQLVAAVVDGYVYAPVTAKEAAADLSYYGDDPRGFLETIPLRADPDIARLVRGGEITRDSWNALLPSVRIKLGEYRN